MRALWNMSRRLSELSAPLVVGLVAAVIVANAAPDFYRKLLQADLAGWQVAGHAVTVSFLVNDGFMTLFFALATADVVRAFRPGGALNPLRRAMNPILASIGGIAAPALVYLALIHGLFSDVANHDLLMGAWAVPTATDIALVWMVARAVFGRDHAAVDFLLVVAVIDDLIGMVIIAVVYSESGAFVQTWAIALAVLGIGVAWWMRRNEVGSWIARVFIPGGIVWAALLGTAIHPSLAFLPVVAMLPPKQGEAGHDMAGALERALKPVVGMGLFFFGFVNAGVQLGDASFVTWIVLTSLIVGKTAGIAGVSIAAARWGLDLPSGMTTTDVVIAGVLASIGLTVSLFVAGEALPADSPYQAAARMGALLSIVVAVVAIALGSLKRYRYRKRRDRRDGGARAEGFR